jgi:hypothetical protein
MNFGSYEAVKFSLTFLLSLICCFCFLFAYFLAVRVGELSLSC